MQRTIKCLLLMLWSAVYLLSAIRTAAQESGPAAIDSAVAHHRFVFYAQWVISYDGQRRQLTPPYELITTSDSVSCYLPYTGRMYTVPQPEDLRFMSIRFTSKKFLYKHQKRKRSGWEITIVPKDVRDVQELFFTISRGGWASLAIRSAGRDRISYEGSIEPFAQ